MQDPPAPEVDIGDGCKRIERAQQNLRRGHSVRDCMENTNPFSGYENLYFERTFDFGCSEMPTSFHFRITFLRSDYLDVTTVATVRRTDPGAGLVNVTLEARVYRNGTEEGFWRHVISGLGNRRVHSAVHHDDVPEMQWLSPRLQEASNLLIEFVLIVERCHSEKEGEEATDTRDSEDSSQKKRLRVQSSS